MKLQIKPGLEIGDQCKPFIIAEVGSNWRNFNDAKESITAAKVCGADAVKFQLFTSQALYGLDLFHAYQLPLEWLPLLKEKADACGIEFMCSAFSPELIDAVNPYVNIHKVASAELTHVRMLEKLRSIGKPVFLSTGASGAHDIGQAIEILKPCPTLLMYCVAAYPALEINLDNIPLIRSTFGLLTGFSDHSTNIAPIPKLAIERGAAVLEKHFCAIDADTPDRPHSLNPAQFKRMVAHIRGDAHAVLGATGAERDMILRHNRRLIATKDMAAGTVLKEGENFGIFRSLKDDSHAFTPFMIGEVNGRTLLKEIKAGQGIGPGDI